VDAGVSVDAVSTSVVTACSTSAEAEAAAEAAAAAAGVSTLACAAPTTREKTARERTCFSGCCRPGQSSLRRRLNYPACRGTAAATDLIS